MKKIFLIVALLLSSNVMAHTDSDNNMLMPESIDPVRDAMITRCVIFGVRAAWGSDARFHNAPLIFKYVPSEQVKNITFGHDGRGKTIEFPSDAIYVPEEFNDDERSMYEGAATFGWEQTGQWISDGRKPVDRFILGGIFYQGCMQE